MIFSCIIPAYNEGARIRSMLESALACPEIHEVIVIDDGSTDHTWDEISHVSHPKLRPIHLVKNVGKLHAFFTALEQARGDYIVMLDADYAGFRSEYLSTMIHPVEAGEVEIALMMWKNSLPICKLLKHDIFSGTRIVPRYIFDNRAYYSDGVGFGLETKMNEIIYTKRLRVRSFYFPDVYNPRKKWKQSLWTQPMQILRTHSILRIFQHMWYIYRQQP